MNTLNILKQIYNQKSRLIIVGLMVATFNLTCLTCSNEEPYRIGYNCGDSIIEVNGNPTEVAVTIYVASENIIGDYVWDYTSEDGGEIVIRHVDNASLLLQDRPIEWTQEGERTYKAWAKVEGKKEGRVTISIKPLREEGIPLVVSDNGPCSISVLDPSINHAPELAIIGNKEVNKGQTVQFTVTASDWDMDTLTLSVEYLPTGAYFDPDTGIFSWIPEEEGTYYIRFEVSDGQLNDLEDINITVNPSGIVEPTTVIANHQCTDISKVPIQWIGRVKSDLRILYFHTSHGAQITTGMSNLQIQYDAIYDFNETGTNGALSYQEVAGDLGHNGDLSWVTATRNHLNQPINNRNVVMWSWCGGASDNTEEGIEIYLDAMNQLESDFPNITFIYMTGHLDGTGESGNLNIMNNLIRDYCIANNKILYDFADIESYNPDGVYFLDLFADDDCSYNNGNWAEEWCQQNPTSDLCQGNSCEHSHVLNCNLKGRAFWWLLARVIGWPDPNS